MSISRILFCCPKETSPKPESVVFSLCLPGLKHKSTSSLEEDKKSRIFGQNVLMGCLHMHANFRSTESKAVPPESLTCGPIVGGKVSENWQAPKTPKSHYTQAYRGGIILSLSFKWPALAVTHSIDVPQTNHNGLNYLRVQHQVKVDITFMSNASEQH